MRRAGSQEPGCSTRRGLRPRVPASPSLGFPVCKKARRRLRAAQGGAQAGGCGRGLLPDPAPRAPLSPPLLTQPRPPA